MKCPNCGLVAPDGTEVCAQCQIVFSKLEESLVKKALQAHSARIKEPVKEIVPPDSTAKCNTLLKNIGRRFVVQAFARSCV